MTTSVVDAELQQQIAEIGKEANGRVGICAVVIETGQYVALNENEHFAMQSVVKVPISMAVLKLVDDEKLDLDEKVGITKDDFVPTNMRSPIRDNNPNGTEMTVRDLIKAAISESDGTASDVLQRVAGDAKGVQAYIDSLGIAGMKVTRTHKEFGVVFEQQYENWSTPLAAAELLKLIRAGSVDPVSSVVHPQAKKTTENTERTEKRIRLTKESSDLILKLMTESNNPPNRIVAGLPKGTVVAHKTGSGGTQKGITSATNDIGIITMLNGNHIAITVFIGDSKADTATREGVIAKITKAIFDKWSAPKSEPAKAANFTDRHSLN